VVDLDARNRPITDDLRYWNDALLAG